MTPQLPELVEVSHAEREAAVPPEPQALLDSGWRGTARDASVLVEIVPNAEHQGFCDYQVFDVRGGFKDASRRPVRADCAIAFATHEYGHVRFEWRPFVAQHEAPATTPPPNKKTGDVVYFIASGPFVKIGFSNDPIARLEQLQCGSPFPLRLLTTILGSVQRERELHSEFAVYRVRNNGEWFRYEGLLASYIESIAE